MRRSHGGAWACGAAAIALLWPALSHASNGGKPRILVDWTDAPCLTVVDRSVDPMLHLTYSITMEDTELTEDEVEDSRRHQFFAFCRGHAFDVYLPEWITQADVDQATMAGAGPERLDPDNVFELNADWDGCWHRITADDDRRPITFAAAAAGVDWDTSPLPAGTYVVEGYTWEPPGNVWSPRPGVVKVVDDPDPANSDPALAVSTTDTILDPPDTLMVEGCVSAMPGSTLTAYHALPNEKPTEWVPFVSDEPVQGESFALEFDPPEELVGGSVMIRVDVADPDGREFTNYLRGSVIVLGGNDDSECADGGFIGGAGCQGSDDGTGTQGVSTGGDTGGSGTTGSVTGNTTASQDPGEPPQGCGCRVRREYGGTAGAWFGLLLLGLRRRVR